MTESAPKTPVRTSVTSSDLPAAGNDCWNRIGVAGDRSCAELARCVHCRNCPTFAAGGQTLLEREPPEGYLQEWQQTLARPPATEKRETLSLVIFRLGPEWLALETAVFREATELCPVHRLPHRKNAILRGLVSIRGELLLCVSLAALLEIETPAAGASAEGNSARSGRHGTQRLVVISRPSEVWAFPVDELFGVQRADKSELTGPPTTLAKAASTFTGAVLPWQGRTVGFLNSEAVFAGLRKRGL